MRLDLRSVAAIAATLVLTLAAPALAGKQEGTATHKNIARSTLTIAGNVYQVTGRTVIEDLEGMRIPLSMVPVASSPTEELRPVSVVYESVETAAGATLLTVRMVPQGG